MRGLTSLVTILEGEAVEYLEPIFSSACKTALVLVESGEEYLVAQSHIFGTELVYFIGVFITVHCSCIHYFLSIFN